MRLKSISRAADGCIKGGTAMAYMFVFLLGAWVGIAIAAIMQMAKDD